MTRIISILFLVIFLLMFSVVIIVPIYVLYLLTGRFNWNDIKRIFWLLITEKGQ